MITNSELNTNRYDICIIGGGASGLAAGIKAKQLNKEATVLIIEKNDSLGRKIRATGNGKCNITNINAPDYQKVAKFFDSIGIITRIYDNGLVYPYSESASDVSTILSGVLVDLGVDVICNAEVTEVLKPDSQGKMFDLRFFCKGNKESRNIFRSVKAKNVIVATGGKAAPCFGSTGDGYKFARKFGHEVVKTIPILAGIECEGENLKSLAGTRTKARVSLFKYGNRIFEEDGEVQFTNYGLSGICIFNMTRFMRLDKGDTFRDFEIKIDLCPYLKLDELINDKVKAGAKAKDILVTIIKSELAAYIIKLSGVEDREASVDFEEAASLIELLHNLSFFPVNIRKWEDAQCTSGGVNLTELSNNFESKLIRGLFFAGEVIDYDGPCGGYNLTNAWSTGISGATGAVNNLI